MLGGEIVAYGPTGTPRGAGTPGLGDAFVNAAFTPDRPVEDGDSVKGHGFTLDVLHMPGHAPDHLCFAHVGKRTVFTGDHVMGWNTTVIAPPEGNMADFLASLERLMQRHDKTFLPGHGGRIQTPQRVVRAYMTHRKWREQTILACLDEGVCTIPRIVAKLYGGLDADLKEAAALSVLAHLEHLTARGMAAAEGSEDPLSAFYVRPARRAFFVTSFAGAATGSSASFGAACSSTVFSPFSSALVHLPIERPDAVGIGAEIMHAVAGDRTDIDQRMGIVALHPDDHVVGEAHDHAFVGRLDAADAALARGLVHDDIPAKATDGLVHQDEDLGRGALEIHGADIFIGLGLKSRFLGVRIGQRIGVAGPFAREDREVKRVGRRGLNVVERRQHHGLGEEEGRQRQAHQTRR